jgi:acetolactate decarboxylase
LDTEHAAQDIASRKSCLGRLDMDSFSYSCSCAQDIATSFRLSADACKPESELYQFSLMAALIDGVFDGDTTISELMEHGDFGLGTFNQLDGELIVFDSEAHQLREDGTARVCSKGQKTPFAVMTHFHPTMFGEIENPIEKNEVQEVINELIESPNLFCAFRIDGLFQRVETRTVPRQTKPYRPMLQSIENQPIFTFNEVRGTLVGFRCPEYVQGINVAGYHVHFITDDRNGGGHVLDYRLLSGKVAVAKISKLRIELPKTRQFADATLHSEEMSHAIRQAEG